MILKVWGIDFEALGSCLGPFWNKFRSRKGSSSDFEALLERTWARTAIFEAILERMWARSPTLEPMWSHFRAQVAPK